MCVLHRGQYFLSSSLCGSLRRLLLELYVRSLQSTQPNVTSILFSPLRAIKTILCDAHPKETTRLYVVIHTYPVDFCQPITFVITPDPTVLPPSLTANLSCSSNATGVIKLTFISILSPGITISTPSGSFISPVTSVVRI